MNVKNVEQRGERKIIFACQKMRQRVMWNFFFICAQSICLFHSCSHCYLGNLCVCVCFHYFQVLGDTPIWKSSVVLCLLCEIHLAFILSSFFFLCVNDLDSFLSLSSIPSPTQFSSFFLSACACFGWVVEFHHFDSDHRKFSGKLLQTVFNDLFSVCPDCESMFALAVQFVFSWYLVCWSWC